MYCANCGSKTHTSANFCAKCGTRIIGEKVELDEDECKTNEVKYFKDNTDALSNPSSLENLRTNKSHESKTKYLHRNEAASPNLPHSRSCNIGGNTSYFKRHWRGELSLVKSYWLNTFCISLFFAGIFKVIEKLEIPEDYPYFSIFIFFLLFPITFWQLVGLWRAAKKYIDAGNNVIWGYLARLIVIFGCLQAVSAVSEISKALADLVKVQKNIQVSKITDFETEFRFINNNKELLVTGGIGSNSAKEFVKVANANPGLSIIHLNNDGGKIDSAYEIYKFIKENGYNTYTSGKCLSACTIMFLAGKQRMISKDGKLGFHSASIGELDGNDYEFINDFIKSIYIQSGLQDSFIEKVLSVPANEIHFPSHQELISSNAVDLIVEPADFGNTSLIKIFEQNKLEELILDNKTLKALKQYYPHLYALFLRKIEEISLDGSSANNLKKISSQFFNSNIREIVKHASSEAINKFASAQYMMFMESVDQSPQFCNNYLFPEKFPSPLYSMSTKMINVADDALYSLIKSKRAASEIDIAKHEKLLEHAILSVHESNLSFNDLLEGGISDINSPLGCQYLLKVYEEIWNNPDGDSAETFRYILTN